MKSSNFIRYGFFVPCICTFFLCCRKQDHFYKEFIKDGEIVYVGKADSVLFHPGKDRAKLSWIITDPNISKMKIYWNDRQDSLVFDVDKTDQIDSIDVVIQDLEERVYSFEIYSADVEDNVSVKVLAEGQVYGDEYISSLANRVLNTVILENNDMTVTWFNSSANMIGSEIHYVDKEGLSKNVFVPDTISESILENVEPNLPVEYRTLFLPDTLSIDTFYTAFENIITN